MWDIDPDVLTAPLPVELWVELTSRCPFDCIFCSRRLRRGPGMDMPFELYRSLIAQLASPETIRLNYSGESGHYPRLVEAITLAKGAGAWTELVSAFASLAPGQVAALAAAPLDRLSISLHTLDAAQFRELYGFGSVEAMRRNLERFLGARGSRPRPTVDFAFVAIERNLDQLEPVAALANELGVADITVHPVLRRDPIPADFSSELDDCQRLRPGFKRRLAAAADAVRAAFPAVRITVANPDVHIPGRLTPSLAPYPGPLPEGARIRSCDQNPWRTMHVLAAGEVVACEVHDKRPLGNLAREPLRDIWHGAAYRGFRRAYHQARVIECRLCPWKTAYQPAPLRPWIATLHGLSPQLLEGWYGEEPSGIAWSRPRASAVIASRPGASAIRIHGFLPPDRRSQLNRLDIRCNGARCGEIQNPTQDVLEFDATFRVPDPARPEWGLQFQTSTSFRGPEQQWNEDSRELGFALASVQAQEPAPALSRFLRRAALAPLEAAVAVLDLAGALARRLLPRPFARLAPARAGVSIIVPERDTPELVARCLGSIALACRDLDEPHETIVIANGSPEAAYRALRRRFPRVIWCHAPQALGFSAAIQIGLEAARYGWVYLANSDVELDRGCLSEALALRSPEVFAVASQILPADPNARRQESGWTDFHFPGGVIEIFDVMPDGEYPRPSFYAGGGSSLFRADVLRRLVDGSQAYNPFYWEDVEWAARAAKRFGLSVIFAPRSQVVHARRATISRFYNPTEVDRIFQRNAFLYQIRNVTEAGSRRALFRAIARSDWLTLREVLERAAGALLARALTYTYRGGDSELAGLRRAVPAGPEPPPELPCAA